jgi:hypothetical protein
MVKIIYFLSVQTRAGRAEIAPLLFRINPGGAAEKPGESACTAPSGLPADIRVLVNFQSPPYIMFFVPDAVIVPIFIFFSLVCSGREPWKFSAAPPASPAGP